MSLKNRINAINKKLRLNPQDEAEEQELGRRLEEARARVKAAGIKMPDYHITVKPGASLAEILNAGREARERAEKIKHESNSSNIESRP